jgi:hypothetical protein
MNKVLQYEVVLRGNLTKEGGSRAGLQEDGKVGVGEVVMQKGGGNRVSLQSSPAGGEGRGHEATEFCPVVH